MQQAQFQVENSPWCCRICRHKPPRLEKISSRLCHRIFLQGLPFSPSLFVFVFFFLIYWRWWIAWLAGFWLPDRPWRSNCAYRRLGYTAQGILGWRQCEFGVQRRRFSYFQEPPNVQVWRWDCSLFRYYFAATRIQHDWSPRRNEGRKYNGESCEADCCYCVLVLKERAIFCIYRQSRSMFMLSRNTFTMN